MVRKGGLEPPRSCDRQPLKLVRLPIPPLPHLEGSESKLSVISRQFKISSPVSSYTGYNLSFRAIGLD